MSRPSLPIAVLVLAVLAVTSAGAVGQDAVSASTPVTATAPGEPNHLAINGSAIAAHNTTTVDIDVGSAISADSSVLQVNYTAASLRNELASVETRAARLETINRSIRHVGNVSDTLRERNRDAIQAYASGEISAADLLRTRARIAASAAEYRALVLTISANLPYEPPRATAHRVNYLRGELRVMEGPISMLAAQQVRQGGDSTSIYVEVSNSGYTLARIEDGRYARETFLGDQWEPDAPDQFAENSDNALPAAKQRLAEVYPWVVANKEAGGGMFGDGIYWTNWKLLGGELTAYVDGATTNVFREYQTRALASFNTTTAIERTNESVRLTVNRTFESGPAKVTLTDAITGQPVDGSITIANGEELSLGEDGTRWVVEPRGTPWVNATAGTTTFSTRLSGS